MHRKELFTMFLSKESISAAQWKNRYKESVNIVFSQNDNTFLLTEEGLIRCDGSTYALTEDRISVAHPMDMKDCSEWKQYFRSHHMKQPFRQLNEPVYSSNAIHPERYSSAALSFRSLMGMEIHGIHADIYEAYYDVFTLFRLIGCHVKYDIGEYHEVLEDTEIILKSFTFDIYTRQVNHIVSILDRMTAVHRAGKNDVSVKDVLQYCSSDELQEMMRIAAENGCADVSAILLQWKKEHGSSRNSIEQMYDLL